MQLKQLVNELVPIRVEGPLDREVAGITYDSRRVTPGMVFVAIPGQKTDGHGFISSAVDRGAMAVVCEQDGFVSQRATKIKVADAREALLLQRCERLGGALTTVAINDHRPLLALSKVRAGAIQPRERQVLRAEHVARGELVRLAHIHHQRFLAVDEVRRLRGVDPRTAGRAAQLGGSRQPGWTWFARRA